jgi:dihydroorotase
VAASVDAFRRAKSSGLNVTCGVSVNHLSLNEIDVGSYRTFFRMSPPLRTETDRNALIQGVADGTIDVIISAHDPHDVEGKRHPFADAVAGAVGLETLFSAAMRLVHAEQVSLMRLLHAMSTKPAEILGLEAGTLQIGAPADLIIFDPDEPWIVDAEQLRSKSKNTAFEDARMTGKIKHTVVAGCRFSS